VSNRARGAKRIVRRNPRLRSFRKPRRGKGLGGGMERDLRSQTKAQADIPVVDARPRKGTHQYFRKTSNCRGSGNRSGQNRYTGGRKQSPSLAGYEPEPEKEVGAQDTRGSRAQKKEPGNRTRIDTRTKTVGGKTVNSSDSRGKGSNKSGGKSTILR